MVFIEKRIDMQKMHIGLFFRKIYKLPVWNYDGRMTRLHILGTGNAQAVACYNTCLCIENEEGFLLVDGGGGNGILGILEKKGIGLSSIHDIFITHIHADHILGIIWMIRRIGETMIKGKMEGDLRIYCHREAMDFLVSTCNAIIAGKVMKLVGDRIRFILHEDGDERTIIGNRFTFFDTGSTKMKQFGFRMEYDGKVLVDAGDEPLSERNRHYARGADYLTHEAFCLYDDRDVFRPYEKHHSTARDAAILAEELGVRNLILYHTEDRTLQSRKERYGAEARSVYSGNAIVPDDLETIEI